MSARPLLTGIGLACPHGTSPGAVWGALLARDAKLGEPFARAGDGPAPGPAIAFAEEFPAESFTDPRGVRKCSEAVRLFAAAAQLAVDQAALPAEPAVREATWVLLGSAFGSSRYYLEFQEAVRKKGPKAANAVLFTESVWNAPAGHASRIHGLMGASWALAGGEEVGLSAAVAGVDRIRLGEAPAVLSGGVEQYTRAVHRSLLREGLVGSSLEGVGGAAPAPFSEGATALLFESEPAARKRGAVAWAQVLGVGRRRATRGDREPEVAALEAAARDALAEAEVEPGALDLVVSGASGGWQTARELAALTRLLPEGAEVAWTAPKAVLGEGFAWTSAAQVAVAGLALAAGAVPPLAGRPPALPRGLIADDALRPRRIERVLVLAASRAGAGVAMLLGPPPPGVARRPAV